MLQTDNSALLANATANTTTNGSHHNVVSDELKGLRNIKDLDKRHQAEVIIVAVICALLMMSMLGCVGLWVVRRYKIELRLPAFMRRRMAHDKFSKYADTAFDNEGF